MGLDDLKKKYKSDAGTAADLKKILGGNLCIIRKELGLTQTDFAEPLGITGAYVSDLERGLAIPSEPVMRQMESVFGISRDFLLRGEGGLFLSASPGAGMDSNKHSTAEVISRMISAVGGRTQADLSEFLEISAASISAAQRKEKIPPEWLVKLALTKDISPVWLLQGVGPQNIVNQQTETEPQKQTFPPVKLDVGMPELVYAIMKLTQKVDQQGEIIMVLEKSIQELKEKSGDRSKGPVEDINSSPRPPISSGPKP